MVLGKQSGRPGPAAFAVPLLLLLAPVLTKASWHECNSQGVFPGSYGNAAMANLTAFRSSLLAKVHPSFNPDADFPKGFGRFDPFSPFLSCPPHRPPSPYHRWRFCDLGRLSSCVVYSVGPVQQDYAFEKDILATTKCEVHTLDCSTEGKSIDQGRHQHHKLCIGQGKPDHKSWQEIVVQLGHHSHGIEALKIGGLSASAVPQHLQPECECGCAQPSTVEELGLGYSRVCRRWPSTGQAANAGFSVCAQENSELSHSPAHQSLTTPLTLLQCPLHHVTWAVQADLEGREAEVFAELTHSTLLPRQLAAELHIRPAPPEATALPQEAPHTPSQLALIFTHLAALGYGVTSRVDNTGGQPGCCSEFGWLHVEQVWHHHEAHGLTHRNHGAAHTSRSRHRSKQGGSSSSSSSGSSSSATFAATEEGLEEGPPRAKRLVVSLASFPGRAEFAAPTVYSIMHGTRKPDTLYFWVAVNVSRFESGDKEVNSMAEIPDAAKMLEKQFPGVVKVLPARMDFGPATKLLPTLEVETDPETIIVTVDDDTFYAATSVSELEQEMLRRPGYAVVRSCENTHWDDTKNPPRKGWREWKLSEGVCRGFMTAYATAAYRRGYLDDLVFEQERAPKGCRHHDDIWFSAHLWIRNVPIWVLNHVGRSWPPMYHRPKNRMSISAHPQAEERAQECLDYFHWMDDEARRKELMGNHTEYVP